MNKIIEQIVIRNCISYEEAETVWKKYGGKYIASYEDLEIFIQKTNNRGFSLLEFLNEADKLINNGITANKY